MSSARPRRWSASATGWPPSTAPCSTTRPGRDSGSCGLYARVFPYVEEHKFYCDYWFLMRFYNKIREFGALLARNGYLADGEDIFMLSRHEAQMALEELCLMWATGGPPLGPAHWPPIVARRRDYSPSSRTGPRRRRWAPCPSRSTTRWP